MVYVLNIMKGGIRMVAKPIIIMRESIVRFEKRIISCHRWKGCLITNIHVRRIKGM